MGRARFSVTSEERRADFEQAIASCFVVDVPMQIYLGDGNQLETGCGGDQCRFSANVLVLRIMPNAYGM